MRMVLNATRGELPIRRLISLADILPPMEGFKCQTYNDFMSSTQSILVNDHVLSRAERRVTPSDVVNLQFTSGVDQSSWCCKRAENNLRNRDDWPPESRRPNL